MAVALGLSSTSGSCADPAVGAAPGGNLGVQLQAAQATRLGVVTQPASAATFPREAIGIASVVDPQSLLQLAAENASASALVDGSARAYARVKALNAADGAASDQALESARAQFAQDRARQLGLQHRLAAEWGGPLSQPAASLVDALAARQRVIVRIELDPDSSAEGTIVGARFESYSGAADPQRLDAPWPAPTRDPLRPGRAWLSLAASGARLTPGERGRGVLSFDGPPRSGVRVPRAAVVLLDRRSWCYVDRGSGHYQRLPISTRQALPDGYFVAEGLSPGDSLVVAGAALLLAEERGEARASETEEDTDDD